MVDTPGTPSVTQKDCQNSPLISSQQTMQEQKEPSIPSYWGKIEELTTAKISIFAE